MVKLVFINIIIIKWSQGYTVNMCYGISMWPVIVIKSICVATMSLIQIYGNIYRETVEPGEI